MLPNHGRLYRKFLNDAIISMVNFSIRKFHAIWDHISRVFSIFWTVGRGRRSKFNEMDLIFMTLDTLKHRGKWARLGKMFDIKVPTFEILITRFIDIFSYHLYELSVEKWS